MGTVQPDLSRRCRPRFSRLGVLVYLLLALAACNRDTRKRIAVIPKGQAHLFWQSVHAGAVAAPRENNVDILWNGPASETDFTGQLQIVESMITQHVDAICLAPIDKTAWSAWLSARRAKTFRL